jgi:catechol 2,3-dioxygenase-like lactoylglutathione lyase family enzyme
MAFKKLGSGAITHIGLIVRDIEATRRHYIELLGASEAAIGETDPPEIAKTQFKGEASRAGARLCHLSVGPIQIELIQPFGGPSTWQEFLDKHGEGVHHIAIESRDAGGEAKTLALQGMPLVQRGEWVGGSYTYSDTRPQLAVLLELIHNQ